MVDLQPGSFPNMHWNPLKRSEVVKNHPHALVIPYQNFLNQRVVIENSKGARYAGVLSGFRHHQKKFCLSNLAIINRHGAYTVAGGPSEHRWFSWDNHSMILEKNWKPTQSFFSQIEKSS
jgi:hypothetical protein